MRGGKVYWKVYRQDRIPADDKKYNALRWNELVEGEDFDIHEIGIHDDDTNYDNDEQVRFIIDNQEMFYGGYYKIELYYERSQNSGKRKHFASVFIGKENSPHNTIGSASFDEILAKTPSVSLENQVEYDKTHELVDGKQTGYVAFAREKYNADDLSRYYYTRETNDCRNSVNNTNNNANYSYGDGLYYGLKGYLGEYPSSIYYIDQHNPDTDSDSTDTDLENQTDEPVTLEQNTRSVYVYDNKETGAYYPTLFQGVMDIMAENGDIRRYTVEHIQNGLYGENDEYNYDNPVNIYQNSAYRIENENENMIPLSKDVDGNFKGIVEGYDTEDIEFQCTWASSNVGLSYTDDTTKSGFNSSRIKVYYTPFNSNDKVVLTEPQIADTFNSISCTTGNEWTFKLKNDAPLGTYEMIPYVVHITDLSANPYKIKLYDSQTKKFIKESTDNILEWTIPYTQPFVIENRPNDDSYLTEFNTSNDQYTPFIVEDSNVGGVEERSAYIRPDSVNQEITYVGYENVKVGDERVNKFNIYSYVAKTAQQSDIRMKAPYMATVTKWVGDSSPFESLTGDWEEVTPTSDQDGIKEYNFQVEYNELLDDGTYSYKPSITYYKVTAEDGITSTIYSVYVVPGVRNKFTTLEIAQNEELPEIIGSQSYKDKITEMFTASDELYQEILDKYGYVNATIKELNGNTVDLYQTKFFDSKYTPNATEPYIYNLKSFAFDISVDLPAGYDYDIILLSQMKDSYSTLKDSQGDFDGKQLILSNSDDQQLHIRIVLKRDTIINDWGVQHIWDLTNANTDPNGKIQNNGGGYFYNYVYKRDE